MLKERRQVRPIRDNSRYGGAWDFIEDMVTEDDGEYDSQLRALAVAVFSKKPDEVSERELKRIHALVNRYGTEKVQNMRLAKKEKSK